MPGDQPLITPPTSSNSTGGGVSFNERFKPVENGATAESLYSLASDAGAEVKRQLKGGGNEVPAGIPLTEALASKGLGNGRHRTDSGGFIYQSYRATGLSEYNYFSPRPSGANDPQGIYSLAQESNTKARSATMMPGFQFDDKKESQSADGHRQLQFSSSLGGSTLDASVGSRGGGSFSSSSTSAGPTVSSAIAMSTRTETNRAELLENGYMAPRRIPRPAAYDYPPFGPPRPADPSAAVVSGTPPRQPHSALLKPAESSPPVPSQSPPSSLSAGGAGRPPTYINMQSLDDSLPPPIDRTTKPTPPAIDRTLKPGGSPMPKSTPPDDGGFNEDDVNEDSDSSGSSPELPKRSIPSDLSFSVADLPKPTNRTTQYAQVEFDKTTRRVKLPDDDISRRAPVPIPRDRDHPVPKPRRVNYSDIDLNATAARVETTRTSSRSPTLRQAEHQHLQDKPYINVNREGIIDDDTDPDYYTHMRVSTTTIIAQLGCPHLVCGVCTCVRVHLNTTHYPSV